MCILIYKEPKHPILKKSVYKRCFDANPDGAGYAWWNREEKVWYVRKGFMAFKKFWKAYNSDSFNKNFLDTNVVTHFRVGTSGNRKGPDCTHPFPVIRDYEAMRKLEFRAENIAFHNGVIGPGQGQNSDTMVGVFSYIAPLLPHINEPGIEALMEEALETNKCKWFITTKDVFHMYGTWLKDEDYPGHEFSNSSYKPKVQYPVSTYTGGAYGNGYNNGRRPDPKPIMRIEAGLAQQFCNKDGRWDWDKWDDLKYTNIGSVVKEDKDKYEGIIAAGDRANYFGTPPIVVGLVDTDGNVEWEDNYRAVDDMMCCPACGSFEVEDMGQQDDEYRCKKCAAIFDIQNGLIKRYEHNDQERFCQSCLKMQTIDLFGKCQKCGEVVDYMAWQAHVHQGGM